MACSPAERLGHAPGLQGQVEDGLAGRGGVKGVVEDPEQPLVLGEVAEEGPPGDLGRLGDLVVRSNPRSSNSSQAPATGETPQNA